MRIEIDNEYFINLDTNGNYTLYQTKVYQKGKNVGDEIQSVIGYYSNVPSALNRYAQHRLSTSGDTVSIQEYLTRYNEIVEKLIKNTLPKEAK